MTNIIPLHPQASVPAFDLDAEAALIGAVLIDGPRIDQARLEPEHFFSESHRRIWEACTALREEGVPIDAVNVGTRLRDEGRIEQVGGMAYLTTILNSVPFVGHMETYAKTVRKKWRARELTKTLQLATARAQLDGQDTVPQDILDRIEQIMRASDEATDDPRLYASEMTEDLVSEQPWLCQSLRICPGAPTLLAGYGSSKKTLFAQELAISVAGGLPVFGLFAARQGKVLHIDYEQGRSMTVDRYMRIARSRGIDVRQLGKNLATLHYPTFHLDDPDARAKLTELATGMTLVIIDSARAAMPSVDENSSEVRKYLDMLGAISEKTGATFVLLHHASKPGENKAQGRYRIRGSGAWYDGSGTIYSMNAERGEATEIRQERDRNGSPEVHFFLELEDIAAHDDEGRLVNARHALKLVHRDPEEMAGRVPGGGEDPDAAFERAIAEVLRVVEKHPGISKAEDIQAWCRRKRVEVLSALRILISDGKIVRVGAFRRPGKYYVTGHPLAGAGPPPEPAPS